MKGFWDVRSGCGCGYEYDDRQIDQIHVEMRMNEKISLQVTDWMMKPCSGNDYYYGRAHGYLWKAFLRDDVLNDALQEMVFLIHCEPGNMIVHAAYFEVSCDPWS